MLKKINSVLGSSLAMLLLATAAFAGPHSRHLPVSAEAPAEALSEEEARFKAAFSQLLDSEEFKAYIKGEDLDDNARRYDLAYLFIKELQEGAKVLKNKKLAAELLEFYK